MSRVGDGTKATVGKLSYAGWIPRDRGFVLGLPLSKDERRRCRLITGTRVPHRVPSPTLRIGRVEVWLFSVYLPHQVLAGVTVRAIAQMKPAISRAIAVVATTFGFPAAIRCR